MPLELPSRALIQNDEYAACALPAGNMNVEWIGTRIRREWEGRAGAGALVSTLL